MPEFSVIILTATPPSLPPEAPHVAAFTRIDGREVLLRAADLFIGREGISGVTVVVDTAHTEDVKRRHGSHFAFTGIRLATTTGDWYAQIAAGLTKVAPSASHIVLHDGARCAVTSTDLDLLLEQAGEVAAAALVAPIGSELLEVDGPGDRVRSVGVRPAGAFVQLLTPQVFTRSAMEDVLAEKALPTGGALRLIPSSPLNVRAAGPGDEKRVKALLAILPRTVKKGDGPFAEAQW